MGRSRYKITDPTQPHFVTLTVLHWIPVFTRPDTVNILFDSIRFLGKEGLKVYAYVVLENHGHFVLQSDALDRDIRRLKSWSAKQLIQLSRSHAPAWECIRRYPMGRSRYKITDPTQPHFVTLTVLHWIPVFTRPDTVNILVDSIRFLGKEGLKVYAYVVLENHGHFVLQSDALDRDIRRLKSWSAKQLIQFLTQQGVRQILDQLAFYKKAHKDDRAYQFWQEGVHPELIQNDEMMRQKIDYIHHNPVKRGYVDEAVHWRYSSARDYAGQAGLLEVCRQW